MNNQLAKVPVKQLVQNDKVKGMIANVLHERAPQFATSIVSIVNSNRSLAKVDQMSVIQSAMVAATLDLPIDQNLGYMWLVPYKGKAQAQIGYKGFIQLAQRSGQYKAMNAVKIYEGELTGWNPLTEEIGYDPTKRTSDEVIGYIGYFKLLNGFEKTVYWTREQIEQHRARFSKAGGNSPWTSDFDAMALKTVLKSMLTKWGPMSTQLAEAVAKDEAEPEPTSIDADEVEIFDDASETTEDIIKGFEETQKRKRVEDGKKTDTQSNEETEQGELL